MSKPLIRPTRALNDDAIEAMNGLHTDWGALPKGGGMQAVVNLLRSEEPIRPEVRALLADLLDPKGRSTWKLEAKKRRRGQSKERRLGRELEIGRQISAGMTMHGDFESAIAAAMAEHKVGRTYATECLSRWRYVEQREALESSEST